MVKELDSSRRIQVYDATESFVGISYPVREFPRKLTPEEEVNDLFDQVLDRYSRAKGATCTSLSLFFDEDENSCLKDKIANFEVGQYLDDAGNKNYFVKTFSAENKTEEMGDSDERKKELLRIAIKEPILASYARVTPAESFEAQPAGSKAGFS